MVNDEYRVLTVEDQSRLRMERVRALEADRYRAELAMEDALSSAELESYIRDIKVINQRLAPHYAKLGLLEAGEPSGESEDGRSIDMVPAEAGRLSEKSVSADQLPAGR